MRKSFCNRAAPWRATSMLKRTFLAVILLSMCGSAYAAPQAPAWMHNLTNAPLSTYDDKTDAVLLYSETNVTVVSTNRIRTQVREAYKILRPPGRSYGTVPVYTFARQKVVSLHGWCIPAHGDDFEVKDKEAIEMAPPNIAGGELVTDLRVKLLHIPAPDPGNIVGYEYEVEEDPLLLQDRWDFQEDVPVRESHYTVTLPAGWEYKALWLNHGEIPATQAGPNQWQWSVSNVDAIRRETDMPPIQGIAGQMILSFFPTGGFSSTRGFSDWRQMGEWYTYLLDGRLNASDALKQQVAELTAQKNGDLAKMRALAAFVQEDIRYVAIELGIGGYQPHAAADVFEHRYGDCKDKATLLRSMLEQVGIHSYHVVINAHRGAVSGNSPVDLYGFNHAILAIQLPKGLNDPSLAAVIDDPKLGRLLFFDPTDSFTPFGQIRGALQANYGLLVTPEGGELVELPQLAPGLNGVHRTAKLKLDPDGTLEGEVEETRIGDRATLERWQLRAASNAREKIKPIEELLGSSLGDFEISKASLVNLRQNDMPFGFNYSFESSGYAKSAGDLLLVRPRVIGEKEQDFLETKEPRKFPIEFEGPCLDTDSFEIALPAGYQVDDLPQPVDLDTSFASYHSKTEAKAGEIWYTRTFEIKQLSLPAAKSDELKNFYRAIAGDERSTAVLKPIAHP